MIGFTLSPSWWDVKKIDVLLNDLWSRGCRSIELYLNPFDSMFTETFALAKLILERGWTLTIHAPTDGDFNIVHYDDNRNMVEAAYRALFDVVASLSTDFKQPILINFHGGQGEGLKGKLFKDKLLKSVRQFVHWLVSLLKDQYTCLRTAMELLPYDPAYVRIGDRQEDLLYISEGIDSTYFGLCWDMGHLRRNREMFTYGCAPKPDFVQRVVHVHVHEVDIFYRDHCPIGRGIVSVADDIKYLLKAGYKNVYNLELSFELAAEFGDPLNELFQSIANLKEMISL